MKYLLIDSPSIDEVINSRQFQSIEFAEGRHLIEFLRGTIPRLKIGNGIGAIRMDGGGFIMSSTASTESILVFDVEEMPGLSALDDSGLLLAIQKTLRFVKKLWAGMTLARHERVISDAKAIVFPYPIGLQTSLRLSIDRNPDGKRRQRREKGQAYLVYKFSDNEGGGPTESPRLTNFRKADESKADGKKAVNEFLATTQDKGSTLASIAVTALGTEARNHLNETGLENWRRWLTDLQLAFVDAPLTAPHRIEGPAGTGKTLCLVLKTIRTLQDSSRRGEPYRALFITHSQATKAAIENLFATNDAGDLVTDIAGTLAASQSVAITTLHELCAHLLHREISASELIDRDAYESKLTQKLYAIEAVEKTFAVELPSHRPFLSPSFSTFIDSTDRWAIAEMLQHEISVQIKGRAEQDLTKYQKLPPLKFGLPLVSDGDRALVFLMYEAYQRELETSAQFDTDDVVLSAISQLATPIWRRRRAREGFDGIFIDETHLFNLNELSVFHKLTRTETRQPIAYSVDRSQALGDRGWADTSFDEVFGDTQTSANVKSVFRCSPEIIDLAFSITSSGATLFTNFHDPLVAAVSAFSADEEKLSKKPIYRAYADDNLMLADAFVRADSMAREMECSRADVAIIVFGDELFSSLQNFANESRKPVEVLRSRGDTGAVARARQGNRYVLSAPEFVGGLEFSGVVIVGVDGGRVPPVSSGAGESQAFLNYAAHQRLYVSVTRAKYRVEVLGTRARGVSSTLSTARVNGLIDAADFLS